ncbi:MAG: hypothetical protein ABSE81_02760 [Candidatus Omnitrophota bacterium]
MKKRIAVSLLLVGFLAIPLFLIRFTYATDRFINYLPRDQELVTVNKNYSSSPYVLGESSCPELVTLNTKVARCTECLSSKALCPDCCINTTGTRETQCQELYEALSTQVPNVQVFQPVSSTNLRLQCPLVNNCEASTEASPGTTDTEYSNFKSYCSAASLPGCQIQGCPTSEPKNDGSSVKCVAVSGDGWVCNQDGIQDLNYSGCVPAPASGSGVDDCYTKYSGKFYTTITQLPSTTCASYSTLGPGNCWQYTVNPDFNSCINTCNAQANLYEQKIKAYDCCSYNKQVCCKDSSCMRGVEDTGAASSVIRPGYKNNCNDDACVERVNWPECQPGSTDTDKCLNGSFCCDQLDSTKCLCLSQERDQLIQGMTKGTSFVCFNDISKSGDDEFEYDFVAKSNEKLMVIWQVQASPEYCVANTTAQENACLAQSSNVSPWGVGAAPNTYFYTLIKIFDVTNGGSTEVYPGDYADTVMNQKSFTAAFSIFAAIATGMDNSTPPKSIFKQGHQYRVKLYYLIAPLTDYVLRSKISQLQLIILRIRG